MAAFGEDYVRHTAEGALRLMATHTGAMRERLERACLELAIVGSDDVPEGKPREIWSELYALVTSIRDPEIGSIRASVRQLHHTKAKRAADLIFELHRALVDQQLEQASKR